MANLLHHGAEGNLGAGEQRGVSHVKREAGLLQGLASSHGFLLALFAKVGIEPTAKFVFLNDQTSLSVELDVHFF